jgi:hypothetical protein
MDFQDNDQQYSQEGKKRVLIKYVGGVVPPKETFIGRGTTSSDLLTELGIVDRQGYYISKGLREIKLSDDEELFPNLQDEDVLFVVPHIQACAEGLKRILVKFVGGTKPPQEVFIGPGTKTSDLLKELGLDRKGFIISRGTEDSTFGVEEVLYPSLEDGDLVYVSSHVDAGH